MDSPSKAHQNLEALERQIEQLKALAGDNPDTIAQLSALREKVEVLRGQVMASMSAWQKTELARHAQRPYTLDYIERVFTDWSEIHGDRAFGDDPAIITGMAKLDGQNVLIIGQQEDFRNCAGDRSSIEGRIDAAIAPQLLQSRIWIDSPNHKRTAVSRYRLHFYACGRNKRRISSTGRIKPDYTWDRLPIEGLEEPGHIDASILVRHNPTHRITGEPPSKPLPIPKVGSSAPLEVRRTRRGTGVPPSNA